MNWGLKPILAAVPKVIAACLGNSQVITTSHPASLSLSTWVLRSVSVISVGMAAVSFKPRLRSSFSTPLRPAPAVVVVLVNKTDFRLLQVVQGVTGKQNGVHREG